MTRLKFIVDCLPYAGEPDDSRQQGICHFIATEVQVTTQDVEFSEVAIADTAGSASLVQPGLVIFRALDPNNQDSLKEFVLRISEAVQALRLYVVRVSIQKTASHLASGLVAGVLSGAGVGRSASREGDGDGQAAGMFLGALLGALIGGAIGSAIAKDGPVLGIWQRNARGIWQWTPANQLLAPVRGSA